MRVIGGKFRGSAINCPRGDTIRPTSDRTRESLFNILQNRIEFSGARVIDLFAGTGALGIEAMSRGAAFCLFVETAKPTCKAIEQNINSLRIQADTQILHQDATRLGTIKAMQPFDLAFADPPYERGLGEQAADTLCRGKWLSTGAIFVLEERVSAFPARLDGFECIDRRQYGDTAIGLFEYLASTPIV